MIVTGNIDFARLRRPVRAQRFGLFKHQFCCRLLQIRRLAVFSQDAADPMQLYTERKYTTQAEAAHADFGRELFAKSVRPT